MFSSPCQFMLMMGPTTMSIVLDANNATRINAPHMNIHPKSRHNKAPFTSIQRVCVVQRQLDQIDLLLSSPLHPTVTSSPAWPVLQREDMQPVHSFKLRGAYNKMSSLSREQLAKGVVACRWAYPTRCPRVSLGHSAVMHLFTTP